MSVVTNAILHMGVLDQEEEPELLKEVNFFFSDGRRGFVLVDDPSLPSGWYGGSKMLECSLAIGAFNHLDLNALLAHLREVDWPTDQRDLVQLIVKEQNDDSFRIINVCKMLERE